MSRVNYLEFQLQTLVRLLTEQKIKYALIGGIAVAIHGEPRLTADIDANIILDKGEIDTFMQKAKQYGFQPLLPNIKKLALKTGVLPLKFNRKGVTGKCDIILAENPLEFAAIKRARLQKIGAMKARIVTPEDLTIHKITSSRPRDLEDLRGILIRQKGRLDTVYIQNWLKKIDRANKGSKLYKTFTALKRGL